MTKDYAKRVYLFNSHPKKKRVKIAKRFLLLFIMLAGGTITVWAVTFYKNKSTVLEKPAPIEKAESHAIHFEFYDELPKLQVKARESEEVISPPPPKMSPASSRFVVQLGVFPDSSLAGELRLSLLLSGIETSVEKIKEGEKVMYRVMRGPFPTFFEAKSFQQKVERKGFESEVKEI